MEFRAASRGREVSRSAGRVLIAGTPEAVSLARAVLGEALQVVAVHSVQEALEALAAREPFHCVVCSLRFDDARMFDFLYTFRASRARTAPRVAYVHASPPGLSPSVSRAIETALRSLGVAAFVDFPALVAEFGEPAAREALRRAILG
jgi:CheY-like chemotaxis protein